jgi:CoA:oxalate CoA-transferase
MTARPLAGVRVVELAQLVSGPYCGTMLAELGADVLKIEPPQGDMARQFGPFLANGESAYFLAVNRGKQMLRLDLRTDEGKAALEEELAEADVLIHNMRVDAARRLGVDSATLSKRLPRLVVCEVSAFGTEGSGSERVGVDLIFQAEAGFMSVTGEPDGPPLRAGTNVPDFFAAISATAGVLAALHERERSGRAPAVSLSLLNATLALQTCWFAAHSAGEPARRLGNASPFSSPTGSFMAADREVVVSVVHDAHWQRFWERLGLDELVEDQRFATNDLRCRHRDALAERIEPALATRTAADWIARLHAAGLPAALAHTYDEVLESWGERFGHTQGFAVAPTPFTLDG